MSFTEIKKKIFEQTPFLKRTLEHKGETKLVDYFEENLTFSNSTSSDRREELLCTTKEIIEKLISPTIAENAIEQLRKHYYVSTADHHGPITHPFFVNSHLAQSLTYQRHNLQNIFVFSCGGISLNNSSIPRGVLFHDQELNTKQLNFVSLKHRHHPVFSFPAYTYEDMTVNVTNNELPKKLENLLTDIYINEQVLAYPTYSDQITYSNYLLWKKIPGQQNTNLIYLEQEDVVNELLLKYHLNTPTIITRLLTDKSVLQIFEKYFDGIQGAFSSESNTGTVLFWAIHKGKRKQLKRRENTLESFDGVYQISLTPDEIKTAIENHTLMPSMALSFIVLSFYHGLTCGGGFLQVNYLTYLKNAYTQLLKEIDDEKELASIPSIKTDYFCSDFVLATIGDKKSMAHASSIDLIIHDNTHTADRLQELVGVCTLGEAVEHMMPQFYKILYGKEASVSIPKHTFPPCIYV